MENSESVNIGTKMCWENLHFLDVKHEKKNNQSTQQCTLSSYLLLQVLQYEFCDKLCPLLHLKFHVWSYWKRLKVESKYVERWLRQREAISHSDTTCCRTSVTNSRAECLLSVNESLICCTMEMGRRVCGPCCFLHQCLVLSQAAPHETTLIFSNRSLKEHKPETFIAASWIFFWWAVIKTAALKVT